MCALCGLNSHYFHTIGNTLINPISRGFLYKPIIRIPSFKVGWVDHPQHREFWHQKIPKKSTSSGLRSRSFNVNWGDEFSTAGILVGLCMGCFRDLWPWFSSGFFLVGLRFWIWVDFHFSCYQKNSWLPERCRHLRLGFNMIDIMTKIHSLKQTASSPLNFRPSLPQKETFYTPTIHV